VILVRMLVKGAMRDPNDFAVSPNQNARRSVF